MTRFNLSRKKLKTPYLTADRNIFIRVEYYNIANSPCDIPSLENSYRPGEPGGFKHFYVLYYFP